MTSSLVVTAGILGLLGQSAAQEVQIGPHRGSFRLREAFELNTPLIDWAPGLTADGLLLVFNREREIFMAERERRGDAFGAPRRIDSLPSDVAGGRISPDGLTIFFSSRQAGGSLDIHVAERNDRADGFGEPVHLGARINTGLEDYVGHVSADGLTLHLSRSQPSGDGGFDSHTDLYVANRPSEVVWWDSDEVTVEPISGVNTAPYGEGTPSVSSDGEVLFFAEWLPVNPTGPGGADIWFAVRGGPGAADFGSPVPLPLPPNSTGHDMSSWISYDWPADGSELWFTRCGNAQCNQTDIWVATWTSVQTGTPFRRGDCNDDGTVDLSDAVYGLGALFLGEGDPGCDDACDSNDDGVVDISDAAATLGVLFLGTGSIPQPGMVSCGLDPTDDPTGCDTFARCR